MNELGIMFQTRKAQSPIGSALNMLRLIYHGVVRHVRKSHRVPLMSIFTNVMQSVTFVLAFIFMFEFMGMRGAAISGDFVIYVMSGIFLYMAHTSAVGAVSGADGPASPMMQHTPMNTVVAVMSAALGVLYVQTLSMFLILGAYYVGFNHFTIYDPVGAFAMFLLSWASGCAIGLAVYAIKPWSPAIVGIISSVYQRANMFASGKMFVANTLPSFMLVMFDWNPLFHVIDQARGYAFINYLPRNSQIDYAVNFTILAFMVALIIEYYTRKRASLSWSAR